MESWAKTTLYAARLVTGASPKRKVNQSNTLIVASSSFDGTYDYRCDGTADDVQIQAAIDYLSAQGGGTVQLTSGVYLITTAISVVGNIRIVGVGAGSILKANSSGLSSVVSIPASEVDIKLVDFIIDGDSSGLTFTTSLAGIDCGAGSQVSCSNIIVQNFILSTAVGSARSIVGFNRLFNATACIARDLSVINNTPASLVAASCSGFLSSISLAGCSVTDLNTTAGGGASIALSSGFGNCSAVVACYAYTITSTAGTSNSATGFNGCNNITNCISENASANSIGFRTCKSVQQCKSISNATPYSSSYSDSGTTNSCDDTYQGGFNS